MQLAPSNDSHLFSLVNKWKEKNKNSLDLHFIVDLVTSLLLQGAVFFSYRMTDICRAPLSLLAWLCFSTEVYNPLYIAFSLRPNKNDGS